MYCLVTNYQTNEKNLGQVTQLFQNQALPLVSKQPGFRGVYLMTKVTGDLMVLNIWETEQQAISWPQNPEHQKVVGQLMPLLIGAPMRDGYQVSAFAIP